MTSHLTLPSGFSLDSPINEGARSKELAPPEKVARYRAIAGLSRENAAALVGYSAESWKGWETGRRPMRESLLAKFASEFEKLLVEVDRLADEARQQRSRDWEINRLPPLSHALSHALSRTSSAPYAGAEINDLPPFSHERNKPTPEQEAIMEADLASGIDFTPEQIHAAMKEFETEQRALAKLADEKALAARVRSEEILAQD